MSAERSGEGIGCLQWYQSFFGSGRISYVGLVTALLVRLAPVTAENVVFPTDAGVVDVTADPYFADSTGENDATTAIQSALDNLGENAILYLPTGIYKVNSTLRWGPSDDLTNCGSCQKRTILQGQSETGTIIKLNPSSSGFGDPNNPAPVIWTGQPPAQRFRNGIRNLTVLVGSGNPGAIGIQYIANNQGSMRNVTIRSEDRQGFVGLDMGWVSQIGPLLIKDVTVEGFDMGIRTAYIQNSITFENITVRNQNRYGLYNHRHSISILGFTSVNTVPALYNADTSGHVVLLDATLDGTGSPTGTAGIINDFVLYAREISGTGYDTLIANHAGTGTDVLGSQVDEFVSHQVTTLFPSGTNSLGLDIKETPDIPWAPFDQWVNPIDYGADPSGITDATSAIQQAIDAGKSTVYFPNGKYRIDSTLYIRGNVTRLIGCEARLQGKGVVTMAEGAGLPDTVVIERMDTRVKWDANDNLAYENKTRRTLVLSSVTMGSYTGGAEGALFLEDVVGGPWRFSGQDVWARQWNSETNDTQVVNDGGSLWVLGFKTEKGYTTISTQNGGKSEILGGLLFPASRPTDEAVPALRNDNSVMSVSIAEALYKTYYPTVVEEIRGTSVERLATTALPHRQAVEESPEGIASKGSFSLPLYVGGTTATSLHKGFRKGMSVHRLKTRAVVQLDLARTLNMREIHDEYGNLSFYDLKGRLIWGSKAGATSPQLPSLSNGIILLKASSDQ